MNTYWDEFMDLLQAGQINDEYGHPFAMTFLTPRRMLEAFYDWLGTKGELVRGCPMPMGVEAAYQQGYNKGIRDGTKILIERG